MEVLYSDDAEAIRQYLSTPDGIQNINNHNDNDRTPLYHACENNRNDVVDVLIEFKANVNIQNIRCGSTPLYIACYEGHIDIVNRLLNANANPNLYDHFLKTPIMVAAKNGHYDIVKLLTIYTDFSHVTLTNITIFDCALYSKNKELIDYVFDYFININHLGNCDSSYLHDAVYKGDKYVIRLLLDKGIDVNIKDTRGRKASDLTSDKEILEILSKY